MTDKTAYGLLPLNDTTKITQVIAMVYKEFFFATNLRQTLIATPFDLNFIGVFMHFKKLMDKLTYPGEILNFKNFRLLYPLQNLILIKHQ